MRYLKNIKSFFSKNKRLEESLYKEISIQEKNDFINSHKMILFSDNEKKDAEGRESVIYGKLRLLFDDKKIITNLFEISKFDDEWYIFEIFDDFDDHSDCFLCDTWDGVKQLLVRFTKK